MASLTHAFGASKHCEKKQETLGFDEEEQSVDDELLYFIAEDRKSMLAKCDHLNVWDAEDYGSFDPRDAGYSAKQRVVWINHAPNRGTHRELAVAYTAVRENIPQGNSQTCTDSCGSMAMNRP